MNKSIWIGMIGAGLLSTACGFGAIDAALPPLLTLPLLTAGLSACLAGMLGLTGLMGWIPGLEGGAAPRPE
ncbi:hypothetical protein AAKU55_001841 [Oxalobacteraceae bacterium GrIS 1.11]